jgi:hypothetical protein
MTISKVSKSLVRVGGGRGFVVQELVNFRRRFIITAAHCLPSIPSHPGERRDWDETLQDLIGLLGAPPSVWAECLFADPIADIAVLGAPDNQELSEQADAYEALVSSRMPLKVGGAMARDVSSAALVVALDGHLIHCAVCCLGGPLWIENLAEPIVGGMSGSPIVDQAGVAIGLISQSLESNGAFGGGPGPRLLTRLLGEFLISLRAIDALNAENRQAQTRYAT